MTCVSLPICVLPNLGCSDIEVLFRLWSWVDPASLCMCVGRVTISSWFSQDFLNLALIFPCRSTPPSPGKILMVG